VEVFVQAAAVSERASADPALTERVAALEKTVRALEDRLKLLEAAPGNP